MLIEGLLAIGFILVCLVIVLHALNKKNYPLLLRDFQSPSG